jgi:hypothetical protein
MRMMVCRLTLRDSCLAAKGSGNNFNWMGQRMMRVLH